MEHRLMDRPDAANGVRSGKSRRPGRHAAALALFAALILAACSEGGGSPAPDAPAAPTPPPPPPSPSPPPPPQDLTFESAALTGRFITQATFGPTPSDIDTLPGSSASDWFMDQLAIPPSLNLPYVEQQLALPEARDANGNIDFVFTLTPGHSFWINAITADDQLRQRMAYALSQIFVVSNSFSGPLGGEPIAIAAFQDILTRNAFGNYRDLMEDVTYSPAMGEYLTYLQNQPGDPITGRVPDENYAREVMQLFTIGLVELQSNGEPALDGDGRFVETYDNDDVTGLARVFTGLSYDTSDFFTNLFFVDDATTALPMVAFPAFHSDLEKTFLGLTIPANTGPEESIDAALDRLFAHPNLPPFICRQLIQRFVASDPDPAYVARVVSAFENGSFVLPDARIVGAGARGDLAATLAAILFDDEARSPIAAADNDFGKLREPVIRFINWARAFNAQDVNPRFNFQLWDASGTGDLAQHPYRSPSVFNFYRPGYTAPGTFSGEAGQTAPELQITNASSIPGYTNFMTFFAGGFGEIFFDDPNRPDLAPFAETFIPRYDALLPLADDGAIAALIDRLDLLLTYETLSADTRSLIEQAVAEVPLTLDFDPDYDGRAWRVRLAVLMVMTSDDYIVQR